MRNPARSKRTRSHSRRGAGRGGARRAASSLGGAAPEALRRIGSRLRAEARQVLREYLGGLSRMGRDTVAFLNALLEEAPAVRAELTHQL